MRPGAADCGETSALEIRHTASFDIGRRPMSKRIRPLQTGVGVTHCDQFVVADRLEAGDLPYLSRASGEVHRACRLWGGPFYLIC